MRFIPKDTRGFTLVEMLVVAPIVILAIGAFLTVIISMTGEVLASRASNTLAYNVQDALNRVEQDVKQSASFLSVNSVVLTAPEDVTGSNTLGHRYQGLDNAAAKFYNVSDDGPMLILNMVATTSNPSNTANSYIYLKNQPNACGSTSISNNTPLTYNIIYFVKDSTLWRRTVMPRNYNDTTNTVCSIPWQIPSCAPTTIDTQGSAGFCKTNDIRLVDGVTKENFFLQYYNGENAKMINIPATGSTDPNVRGTALQAATTVSVSVNASQSAGGREVTRSASLRVSRLDTNASSVGIITAQGAPVAPTVSARTAPGASATFNWPTVTGATGYTIDYNINGGGWINVFTNQNNRTATISANANEDTINVQVRSIGPTGTASAYSTSTLKTPLWESLNLQGDWVEYGSPHAPAQYTKTKDGMVLTKGMIKKASAVVSGETFAQLPDGYRPTNRLLFGTSSAGASARIDVLPDGSLQGLTGVAATWLSLDTLRFVPDGRYPRVAVTPVNGWTNRVISDPNELAVASYVKDSSGRIVVQGFLEAGTVTSGTRIFDLPAEAQVSGQLLFQTRTSTGFGHFMTGLTTTTGITARGSTGTWMAVNSIFYPASYSGAPWAWNSATPVGAWLPYGSGYAAPSYAKSDTDNVVVLRGLVKSGSTTAGNTIINLPQGFRPKERLLFTTTANNAYSRIDVLPTGAVIFQTGSNAWLALESVTFKAEQ